MIDGRNSKEVEVEVDVDVEVDEDSEVDEDGRWILPKANKKTRKEHS